MKKNLTILKTVFLFLFAVFLLQGCRTEDLSASSNPTTEKRTVHVRKVFPKEFQKIKNLNEKFEVSSKKLSQQSISGKNILDGAVIDSTFAMETTDGKSISYTFAVYRNNQKDYIENLVLQKNVDDTEFKSFLYKYKRKGLIGYDANNIEVYKIETSTSSNSRMSYTDKTYSNGCYDIIVTTVDCGEGGHHTNGQYCPALGYKVPSDYVTVRNNCSGGGDNDGTDTGYPSGNTGTGGSYGNTGGGGQTTTTTPVATTPKWNWGRTSVVNFLGLTSEQLNFINNSAQDEFRAQMLLFISNNGIEDPLANPSEEFLSTEVKSLGQWMVNYAMTHSDFLNSEFRNVFLNADLDFLQWSKSFLIQNPNTSWSQFQKWFIDGYSTQYIDNLTKITSLQLQDFVSINKEIDASPYEEEFVKEANEEFVAFATLGDIDNLTVDKVKTMLAFLYPQFYQSAQRAKLINANYQFNRNFYPEWSKARCLWEASRESIQSMLDLAGLIPVIGEACDLTNGVIYTIQGDKLNAGLSYASAIPIAGWFASGVKIAGKVVNKAASHIASRQVLKWIVATDGIIKFGNRSQLRKVLQLTDKLKQAHHIIPWEFSNYAIVQKAAKSSEAFHMNDVLNGIPLPTTGHLTGHNIYNSKLQQILLDLNNKNPNMSVNEAYNHILAISNQIKTLIKNNPSYNLGQIATLIKYP